MITNEDHLPKSFILTTALRIRLVRVGRSFKLFLIVTDSFIHSTFDIFHYLHSSFLPRLETRRLCALESLVEWNKEVEHFVE